MGRQDLSVVGGFYKDPNLHWSAQDVLNWIPVPAEKVGTRTRFQFRDAPGLKPFVRITKQVPDGEGFVTVDQGPVRGMRNVEGKLFVVAGTTLYQISNTGVAIPYGTIPGVGRVSMAHNERGNGNQLLIVNGSSGYVLDTVTLVFQKITDPGYPGAFIADFCDGYLAQVEPQGRFWFHSDLGQALDYNTFDQVEAEADPDRIVGLHVAFREVLIFGADTIQPFVNTGAAQGTFQAAANTLIQCGCSAKFSPRTMDNATFFLDDQRIVRRLQAYNPIRVSTVGIEAALGECSREEIASAWGTTFEDRGHKVYYLTVPGRFTFGYDVLSGEWHRRGSPGRGSWRLSEVVFWNGKWIGGDFQSGRLYELDWKYSLDACEELERERVTGVLSADQNELTLNEMELLFNTGGAVSTCVLFPDQPEGPALSGSAPDGAVGITYVDFNYTATAGDNPLAGFSLISGALPPGLGPLSVPAELGGGIPSLAGTYSLGLRLTDSAGLYASHTDTIVIRVPWFGVSQDGPGDIFGIRSPGGLIWESDLEPQIGGSGVFSGDGLVVQVKSDEVGVSSDFGETFTAATGIDAGVTVLASGDYAAGAYFIRSNGGAGPSPEFDDQQCYRSANGYAYTRIELPSNLRAISKFIEFDGSVFGFGSGSIGGNTCVSTDGGVTFDATLLTCFDSNINANDAATDGAKMIVVGAANTLSVTTDGSTFTELTSPFAGTDDLLLCAWSAGRWVIVNAIGEIAHSTTGTNGSWTEAAYTIPTLPNDIDGYEGRFVIACEDGNMVVSDGGTVFSLAASDFPGSSNVTGVSAYRPPE